MSSRWEIRRMMAPNRLWGSNGVAFGPDGRLYIAQFLAGRISALDLTTGDLEDITGPDSPVEAPDDLAFGPDGAMYIADLVPGRVWRRTPAGDYDLVSDSVRVPNGITCVGDRLFVNEMRMNGRLLELFPGGGEPVVLTEGLALGNAMQRGPDGNLYYPHMVTGQIFRISPDGGDPELVEAGVSDPVAVRFDRGGVLQVLSRGVNGVVTCVDLFGSGGRTEKVSNVAGLDNAAFDAENRMFVSSFSTGGVLELHPDGRTREIVPRGLSGPYGITVDLHGRVHAGDHYRIASPPDPADELLHFVHGIVADGDLLHLTSQYGQVKTYDRGSRQVRTRASGLDQPLGLCVRADGAILVAEAGAGRVVAISPDDTVTPLVTDLGHPVDVALDASGRLYISDSGHGVVYRDSAVVLADLIDPQGIAVRGDELFVVEAGTRSLRVLDLVTGSARTDITELAVGTPLPCTDLFTNGMPGVPQRFAGLAVAPDGTLHLAADGEGTILSLLEKPDEHP
ncbi:Vgb family protein [Winogradskya consettensis]|nr:hypothetical protein [Actinoplanes consettensis]